MIDNVLKFNFVWISALARDQTPVSNHGLCFQKCWKITQFEQLWEILSNFSVSGDNAFEKLPKENIRDEVICSTSSQRKPFWWFTVGSTCSSTWFVNESHRLWVKYRASTETQTHTHTHLHMTRARFKHFFVADSVWNLSLRIFPHSLWYRCRQSLLERGLHRHVWTHSRCIASSIWIDYL